jgi:hypothetical protein
MNEQEVQARANALKAEGGTRRSRGHWGILDNVIGGPHARKRVRRSQTLERRQPRDENLS